MKGKLKYLAGAALMVLGLMAGSAVPAAAQQAVLYELVENMTFTYSDFGATSFLVHRTSNWTAQGSAQLDSPFCPSTVFTADCTVTAFGMDDIVVLSCTYEGACTLALGSGANDRVWANIAAVQNTDNVVDAPEGTTFTGQITGKVLIFSPASGGFVTPDLSKNKSLWGPALPLLYVTDGKFFPDASPTVRTTEPPGVLSGGTATFDSTFRLPFQVAKTGKAKPERGKNAYYLADNGGLIKLDKQNEFALGFALLRAEVYFTTP